MASPGDVIGETDCPCCGNRLPVKLNKNKTAYVICMKIIIPETRERCGYKSSFGRKKSRDLIQQFEKDNHVPLNESKPVTEAPEPSGPEFVGQPETQPGAIAERAAKPRRALESWFSS